jgi:hypothetical protein
MNKIKILILVFALFFITGYARAETIWFSPLTAIPWDPITSTRSLVIDVNPLNDALEVTTTVPVAESNKQWVILGLTAQAKKAIKGVQVCYEVITDSPGSTYISTVSLTTMTTPNSFLVLNDDGTNLTSTSPTCYTSNMPKKKPQVSGTTSLELRMVFGNATDKIRIGGVALIF